jgi:hypothetical protein
MATIYHRKKLFYTAIPMGFIDFLVPFARTSIVVFETVVFALSTLSLVVAWYVTRDLRKSTETAKNKIVSPSSEPA